MAFVNKVRAAAGEAATKAKEAAHEAQLKHELANVHEEVGALVFDLVEAGELAHEKLDEKVERIRTLRAELAREHA